MPKIPRLFPTGPFRSEPEQLQTIWKLAWPQTAMMFFHFLIGFVDVYVAGQISDRVQASLGMITQALFFFLIIAMALANGAVSAISQSLGAGKPLRARRYVSLCLVLVFLASLVLTVFSFLFRPSLLALLQAPDDIRAITDTFLRLYLLLLPVYSLFVMSNAVFRAQKQVFVPLIAMVIVTACNTVGDFGLCFGLFGLPEIGYRGLAWATFGSVFAGCLFNLTILSIRGWLKPSSLPPLRWSRRALPYLWQVAWPAGFMQALWQTAYLILFSITASLPRGNVTALAALAAGLRVESILFLPAVAFNMTASILVGHELGHGDFPAAKRIGLRTWILGLGLIIILAVLIWLAIEPVASLLSSVPEVQAEIVNYLHFNILAIPFTATGLILGGAFIGAGATRYNMAAIGTAVWLIRLPLATVLGHSVIGTATGVWMSMLVSQAVQASIMLYLFCCRDWSRFSMMAHKHGRKTSGVPNASQIPAPVTGKAGRV